jgi:guanine nucleotide-binding protein subunit alpha
MGACMSSSNEEADQKKKSQAIDKILEEDSKRLRKECKILLLGKGVEATGEALNSSSDS